MRNNIYVNGWSSYITWRVFNDIICGIDFKEKVSADELKEIVNSVVLDNYNMKDGSHLVEEYASSFIDLADYEEIAETINLDIK